MGPIRDVYVAYDHGGTPTRDVQSVDQHSTAPSMTDIHRPRASTRTVHTLHREPTWRGIALHAGFVVLIPLTLFALAHPLVVAAGLTGVTVGWVARPLRSALARHLTQHHSDDERSATTVAHTALKD